MLEDDPRNEHVKSVRGVGGHVRVFHAPGDEARNERVEIKLSNRAQLLECIMGANEAEEVGQDADAQDFDPTKDSDHQAGNKSLAVPNNSTAASKAAGIEVVRGSEEMEAPLLTSAMWPAWLIEQQGEYVALCAGLLQHLREAYFSMDIAHEHLLYVMVFTDAIVGRQQYLPQARQSPHAKEMYWVLEAWVQKLAQRCSAAGVPCGINVKFNFPGEQRPALQRFVQSEIMRHHLGTISSPGEPAERPFRLLLDKVFREAKERSESELAARIKELEDQHNKDVAAVKLRFSLGEHRAGVQSQFEAVSSLRAKLQHSVAQLKKNAAEVLGGLLSVASKDARDTRTKENLRRDEEEAARFAEGLICEVFQEVDAASRTLNASKGFTVASTIVAEAAKPVQAHCFAAVDVSAMVQMPAGTSADTRQSVLDSLGVLRAGVQSAESNNGTMQVCTFDCAPGDACKPVNVASSDEITRAVDAKINISKGRPRAADPAFSPMATAAPLPARSEYYAVCEAVIAYLHDTCWALPASCDHTVQIALYTCGSERILPDQEMFFAYADAEAKKLAARGVKVCFSFFGFDEMDDEHDATFKDKFVALSCNPAKAASIFRLRGMAAATKQLLEIQQPACLNTMLQLPDEPEPVFVPPRRPTSKATAPSGQAYQNLLAQATQAHEARVHEWSMVPETEPLTAGAKKELFDRLKIDADPPKPVSAPVVLPTRKNRVTMPTKKVSLQTKLKKLDKLKPCPAKLPWILENGVGGSNCEECGQTVKHHSKGNFRCDGGSHEMCYDCGFRLAETVTTVDAAAVAQNAAQDRDFESKTAKAKEAQAAQDREYDAAMAKAKKAQAAQARELKKWKARTAKLAQQRQLAVAHEEQGIAEKRGEEARRLRSRALFKLSLTGGGTGSTGTQHGSGGTARWASEEELHTISSGAYTAAVDYGKRGVLSQHEFNLLLEDTAVAPPEAEGKKVRDLRSVAWASVDVYAARLNPQSVRVKGVSNQKAKSKKKRAQFFINDILIDNGPTGRALAVGDGLNVMTVNQNTGAVLAFATFATHNDKAASNELITHIRAIKDGHIAMVVASGAASVKLTKEARAALRLLGGTGSKFGPNASFALTGVKMSTDAAGGREKIKRELASVELIDEQGFARKANFQFDRPLRKQQSGAYNADIVESRLEGTLYTVVDLAKGGRVERDADHRTACVNGQGQFVEAMVTRSGLLAPALDAAHMPIAIEQPDEVYKQGVNVGVWKFQDVRREEGRESQDKFEWLCKKCVHICDKLKAANPARPDKGRGHPKPLQTFVVIVVMNSKVRSRCWEEDDLYDYENYVQRFLAESRRGESYMCVYADECNPVVAKWLAYLELPDVRGGPIGAVEVEFGMPLVDANQRVVSKARASSSKSCLPCGGKKPTPTANEVGKFAIVLNHLTLPRMDEWDASIIRKLTPAPEANGFVDWLARKCPTCVKTNVVEQDDPPKKSPEVDEDVDLTKDPTKRQRANAGLGKFNVSEPRSWNPFSFEKKVKKAKQLVLNQQRQAILRRVIRAQQKGADAVIIPVKFEAYVVARSA